MEPYPVRVVMALLHSFTPKVLSSFHLNQETLLPEFKDTKTSQVHLMDVGRSLQAYLEATEACRQCQEKFMQCKARKPSTLDRKKIPADRSGTKVIFVSNSQAPPLT